MLKKSSWWLVILACVVLIGFLATGCAKKSLVKEEVGGRPAVAEVKPTPPPAPAPTPAPAPRAEAPAPAPTPAPAPKAEAPPAAPAVEPIDLASLRLQFAFDDYSLSAKAKENLEKLAGWMKKSGAAKIQVEGHTCDIGTNEYNLALGERRANSAKAYLEGMGITSGRISTISYGEERPMLPNKDESNRSKNRRDEFVLSK